MSLVIVMLENLPFTQLVPADDKRLKLRPVRAEQSPKRPRRSEVCWRGPRISVVHWVVVVLPNLIAPKTVDMPRPSSWVVGGGALVWRPDRRGHAHSDTSTYERCHEDLSPLAEHSHCERLLQLSDRPTDQRVRLLEVLTFVALTVAVEDCRDASPQVGNLCCDLRRPRCPLAIGGEHGLPDMVKQKRNQRNSGHDKDEQTDWRSDRPCANG